MSPFPEILSPAGDMTCLQAALDAGADAVYLGLASFNMRAMATRNFTRETLPEASARCRARGVKVYLTLNTLIYENELDALNDELAFAKPFIDAVMRRIASSLTSSRESSISRRSSALISIKRNLQIGRAHV